MAMASLTSSASPYNISWVSADASGAACEVLDQPLG